jgi:uncharacterized protein (TIGR03067 family)
MSKANPVHPAAEQLTAFGLGQLDEASLLEIESHLAECPSCREVAAQVADDTLVSLLRSTATEPEGQPAPHEMPTQAPTTSPPANPATPGVPPELVQHPRYRMAELLGVGGMGAVYKAEHLLMERPVALKVINRGLMTSPAMVERFRREVKAAARLTHPNIVNAYDAEQAGDVHFLVMEHVEGQSLAAVVADRGPLPVAEACEYVRQAALGLQHAHERGMVHRDVKPHNLMRTPGGQIKILDFGLARFARESVPAAAAEAGSPAGSQGGEAVTQVGTVMGTPDYIAPEQACNAHDADIRADIYSLGCTLYHLLAGHAPFPDGTPVDKVLAHVERMPRPLTEIRADVPPELARVVERMLAKDPAARYQTPAEVGEALRPFTSAAPPRKRRRRLLAAAVLAVAAMAAGAILYVQTDKGEFVIETADDSVAVMVNKRGVKIKDQVSGREYLLRAGKQDVRTGVYEVLVSELPEGIEVTAPSLTVKRGGLVRAVARLRGPSDKDLLQGTWRPVRAEVRGNPVPETLLSTFRPSMTFTGNRVYHKSGGPLAGVFNFQGFFVLDPSQDPKTIDFAMLDPAPRKTLHGIYKLDRDELKVCIALDADVPEDRPTEFASKAGRLIFLLTLRRSAPLGDYELLQGTWRAVSGEQDGGKPIPEGDLKSISITFAGQQGSVTMGRYRGKGTFTLDTTQNPRHITVIKDESEGFQGMQGIYSLEGDTLRLCMGEPRDGRPTEFRSRAGTSFLSLVLRHETAAPPPGVMDKEKLVNAFGTGFRPITRDGVTESEGGWRIDAPQERVVRLYEVQPPLEDSLVVYKARMKSADLKGEAYLELWCRMPGGGESFSRGLANPIRGNTDWTTFEIPFVLQKDERPDLFKLNVHIAGTGTVWIKDVELWQAPLPPGLKRPPAPGAGAGGKPKIVQAFGPSDKPVTLEGVTADQKGWRIEAKDSRAVNLFEVKDPGVGGCLLTYRAQMKSSDVQGKAYLEMWCHLPGDPDDRESFSRGLQMPVAGTTEWASYETPFLLEKGQKPDRIKLGVRIEGKGTVWLRDVELLQAPLPGKP